MSSDPHQLRPDHLPTPFTADEIRVGCPPGRTVHALIVEAGEEPYVHVTRFVSGDTEGADQESWRETTDGVRLTEPQRRRSTWLGFQGHASMPAETTTITEEDIDIPAGHLRVPALHAARGRRLDRDVLVRPVGAGDAAEVRGADGRRAPLLVDGPGEHHRLNAFVASAGRRRRLC